MLLNQNKKEMKKNIIIALSAIALFVALASCNSKSIDPIHGTQKVTSAFYTNASGEENFPLDRFYELGQAGDTTAQRAMIDEYRRVLTANIVRQYPEITDENNIRFVLGSGFAKDVMSGNGKAYSGPFKNELIIILNDPSIHDTLFLACGNGMLKPLKFSDLHNFGTAQRWRIVIEPNKGLANYCPEFKKWTGIANELDIPILDKDGNVVPVSIYSNILGEYTSYLWPYDIVDLLNGKVYDSTGVEVKFDVRLEAAKARAEQEAKAAKNKKNKRRR